MTQLFLYTLYNLGDMVQKLLPSYRK